MTDRCYVKASLHQENKAHIITLNVWHFILIVIVILVLMMIPRLPCMIYNRDSFSAGYGEQNVMLYRHNGRICTIRMVDTFRSISTIVSRVILLVLIVLSVSQAPPSDF